MDDATKRGYGMMMLEQGLPKSHFYASAIARLKRDVARDVGPPVKPHLPFGVLGSGRDRVPSTDLAAITAKLDRLHANLEAFRGERAADLEPRGDGRDPATVALYERLLGCLDGPQGLGGRFESLQGELAKDRAATDAATAAMDGFAAETRASLKTVAEQTSRVEADVGALRTSVAATTTDVALLTPKVDAVLAKVERMDDDFRKRFDAVEAAAVADPRTPAGDVQSQLDALAAEVAGLKGTLEGVALSPSAGRRSARNAEAAVKSVELARRRAMIPGEARQRGKLLHLTTAWVQTSCLAGAAPAASRARSSSRSSRRRP